jgi:hypothetical protein
MESSQGHGASEFHMLKVADLKLFHPVISSVLFGTGFIIATQSPREEGKGGGGQGLPLTHKFLFSILS